jgi:hypothetical protein
MWRRARERCPSPSSPPAIEVAYTLRVGMSAAFVGLRATGKPTATASPSPMMIDDRGNEAVRVVKSDKANMDVEAFEDGYLAMILMRKGETAEVRAVVALAMALEGDIASIAEGGGGSNDAAAPAPVVSAEAGPVPGGSFVFSLDMQIMFEVMEVSAVLDWTRDKELCIIALFCRG